MFSTKGAMGFIIYRKLSLKKAHSEFGHPLEEKKRFVIFWTTISSILQFTTECFFFVQRSW